MPKRRLRLRGRAPVPSRQSHGRIPGNSPQRQDHPFFPKQPPLLVQKPRAIAHLLRQRLISRRRTPRRRTDIDIPQDQPIPLLHARRLIGKPDAMKSREQEIPRPIAGEYATRPIRPMSCRRQSHDPDPRRRVAKPRHRLPPILPLHKRPSLLLRHVSAVCA